MKGLISIALMFMLSLAAEMLGIHGGVEFGACDRNIGISVWDEGAFSFCEAKADFSPKRVEIWVGFGTVRVVESSKGSFLRVKALSGTGVTIDYTKERIAVKSLGPAGDPDGLLIELGASKEVAISVEGTFAYVSVYGMFTDVSVKVSGGSVICTATPGVGISARTSGGMVYVNDEAVGPVFNRKGRGRLLVCSDSADIYLYTGR